MALITVVVQYPSGKKERRELTVPDKTKVWELTQHFERELSIDISAEIATEETVLIGKDRLQPVVEGGTYILTAPEES
jgi:hypothetical protein